MKNKLIILRAYLSMLFFDLIQLDCKFTYKQNRAQSKGILALLKARLISNSQKKTPCRGCEVKCIGGYHAKLMCRYDKDLVARFGEGKQYFSIITDSKTGERRML